MSLRSRIAGFLTSPLAADGQADQTNSSVGQTGSVVTTDLTVEQLKQALHVAELNQRDEETGNMLSEYVSEGSSATRTLQTPIGADTIWSETIEVPLEDPNDPTVKYTYYVVETEPEGSSDQWTTTYSGQENGLGDKGEVIITNRKKAVKTDIHIWKQDNKANGLAGAIFTLQKQEGEYQNIMSIPVSSTDSTKKYGDVTGVDANSSFVSPVNDVTIGNLPDGTYKLIEESAPDGYVIQRKEVDFSIENGKLVGTNVAGQVTFDGNTALITIVNEPGAALPNTGGPGTRMFFLIGVTLTGLAGAGLVLTGKKKTV